MNGLGFRGFDYENPPKTLIECRQIMELLISHLISAKSEKEKIHSDKNAGIDIDKDKLRKLYRSSATANKTREFLILHMQKLKQEEKLLNIEMSKTQDKNLIRVLKSMVTDEQFSQAVIISRGQS